MRALLHLLATLVVLPYLALAGAFVLLGRIIAAGSLPSIILALLEQVLWLIPWGLLGVLGVLLVLIALGFSDRLRWLGASCLFAVAAACLILIASLQSGPLDGGQLLFLLPCFAVAAFAAWLALVEWRLRGRQG
jgi:hypothetical protein